MADMCAQQVRIMQKRERSQSALHFVGASKPGTHKVFCDSIEEVKGFDPAQHLDTPAELLSRTYNRPRQAQLDATALPASEAIEDSLGRMRCARACVQVCDLGLVYRSDLTRRPRGASRLWQWSRCYRAGGRAAATGSWRAGGSATRSSVPPLPARSSSRPSRCARPCASICMWCCGHRCLAAELAAGSLLAMLVASDWPVAVYCLVSRKRHALPWAACTRSTDLASKSCAGQRAQAQAQCQRSGHSHARFPVEAGAQKVKGRLRQPSTGTV